jgi:flagella basal body P-ring formation protein FlgA
MKISLPHMILVCIPIHAQECLHVDGPQVTAKELNEVFPDMKGVPADAVFGYTPAPGAIRWLRATELEAFASRNGGMLSAAHGLCVRRSTRKLELEEVRAAVIEALKASFPDSATAQVQILDFSKEPMPPGQLQFDARHLGMAASSRLGTALLWRGRLRYDTAGSLPFWVSLKADVARKAWVAVRTIEQGELIQAADLREQSWLAPISRSASAAQPEEIVGREASVRIGAGKALTTRLVREPYQIRRGETVAVTLQSGNTRLGFEGRALSSGRAGDVIPIESATSRKLLRGRLSDGRKVVVELENSLEKNHRRVHRDSAAAGSNVRASDSGRGVIQEEESRSVRTGPVPAVR